MPTPNCLFSNKNPPNPEHSIIFRNTSANVSPHLWNKSSYHILRENPRAIHCAPPLLILRSWERCLPIMLDCPPVQSYRNSTANFRVHRSATFLLNGNKRPLLMVCFLKHLETSPFSWRQFCRCAIKRLGHAFPWTRKHFYKWHPDSEDLFGLQLCRRDVLFGKLWRNFFISCLSCVRRAFPRANLHIFIFHTCAACLKVASVSSRTKASDTLRENRKGHVCLLLLFHAWKNPELLGGYLNSQNALLILMIFGNKYSRAVTVHMYE